MIHSPSQLHGIVEPKATWQAGLPAHQLIPLGDFFALVSPYHLDTDTANVSSETLTQAVADHHAILLGYCADHALLPIRFPTLFSGLPALSDMIAKNRTPYCEGLRRLSGQREYSFELFVAQDSVPEGKEPKTGRDYLKQRQRARDRQKAVSYQRHLFVQELREQIAQVATQPPHFNPCKPDQLLDATALIATTAVGRLKGLAGDTHDAAQRLGMALQVKGPWPAYRFATDFSCPEKVHHDA